MINFIIVDDVVQITKTVENIINKIMLKSNFEYKIHIFNDYDSNFLKLANSKISNKIYFLDIETKSASGLDIARNIRKKDNNSVISFITAHEHLGGTIIKESLMVLTFICKFDDFEVKVRNAVIKSLNVIGAQNVIKFNDNDMLYIIPISDILYITRDSYERKCIIKTDNATYKVTKTLAAIKEMSLGLLTQTHRSCLVNEKRIRKIDKVNNTIIFDNDEVIDLMSASYKKELM